MSKQSKKEIREAATSGAGKREQLVAKAMGGNKEALQDLCRDIAHDVLFSTSRILNNPSDAEDAAQEVLIRLCMNIHDLRSPKAFNAWLGRIITNEARRVMQKNSRSDKIVNITEYIDSLQEENEEFLPQDFALREEDRRNVIDIVDLLPERQREAIILHYYNGLSVTETAEAMDVKQQVASRYLKLAREKIKAEMEKQDESAMYSARGLVFLPIGQILSQVFSHEAGAAAITNSAWLQQALISGQAAAGAAGGHAAVGAAGAAGTAGGQAAAASAGIGGHAAVGAGIGAVKTIAAIMVTISVTTGAIYGVTRSIDQRTKPAIVVTASDYDIVFTGGKSGADHVNPKKAAAFADTDHGEMTAESWEIVLAGSSEAIYSGEGDVVEEELAGMKILGEYGEYTLIFNMHDAAGAIYTLSRDFTIR